MQKSVLITGASTGIGLACTQHLAQLGWRVFAGVRKTADAEKLKILHPNIHPLMLDVTQTEQIKLALQEISAMVGNTGLQGLVNNAGVAVAGPVEFMPLDQYRRQFEINYFGQIAVTQACLPLIRQARGRIVFISSVAGRISFPFMSPYTNSKHALEALAEALRVEVHKFGVRVAVVCPGRIATPIWEKSLKAGTALLDQFGSAEQALYREGLDMLIEQGSDSSGLPAQAVADKVSLALTSRFPRPRYIVGLDARMGDFLGRLPATWRDALIKLRLKSMAK
jgi:NAD(P)-dependent dehydrogenase (short-subunit alcohol dehydrogenase family)